MMARGGGRRSRRASPATARRHLVLAALAAGPGAGRGAPSRGARWPRPLLRGARQPRARARRRRWRSPGPPCCSARSRARPGSQASTPRARAWSPGTASRAARTCSARRGRARSARARRSAWPPAAAVAREAARPAAARGTAAAGRRRGHGARALRFAAQRPGRPAPGGFDLGAYLRRRGVAGELQADTAAATGAGAAAPLGLVDAARRRGERSIAAGLERGPAALARGMVLGQDELIDPATKDDFRASGLAHLLAVSGQNVMLLAALALPLLAAAGMSPPRADRGHGGADRVLRAARGRRAVAAARRGDGGGVAGGARGRPAGVALVRAAAGRLRHPGAQPARHGRPRLAALVRGGGGNPGARAAGARRARRRCPAPWRRAWRSRSRPPSATAPLLAHHFGTLSLAGLPANVLALPVVAPIMWLGLLRVGGRARCPGWRRSTDLLGRAAWSRCCARSARWPPPSPRCREPRPRCRWARGRRSPSPTPASPALALARAQRSARAPTRGGQASPARWRRSSARRRAAVVVAAAAVAALALARLTADAAAAGPAHGHLPRRRPGRRHADPAPRRHARCCSTAARPRAAWRACCDRRASRRLSALVMTHASRDHHGGLPEVVRAVSDRPAALQPRRRCRPRLPGDHGGRAARPGAPREGGRADGAAGGSAHDPRALAAAAPAAGRRRRTPTRARWWRS